MTIPNYITAFRILSVPPVLSLLYSGYVVYSAILLFLSMASDFLDGWLARKLEQTSPLGALLDPIADKFMIIVYFPFMVNEGGFPLVLAILSITRNVAQLLAIPILGWWLQKPFKVKPKWPPKVATTLSFVFIPLYLYFAPVLWMPHWLLQVLMGTLVVSLGLECYILVTYLIRLWQIAHDQHDTFE